jgi:uncharacterized RDD family membrane protein YckC
MDRNIDVRTPESISFRYELAGLGSRFLAVFVDTVIQVLILFGIVWGLFSIARHLPPGAIARGSSAEEHFAQSAALSIVIAVVFLLFYGYYVLFEAFWNGQTPGKKLLGIRVVRDGGYPIDFGAALVRNLLRIGEELFGMYAISAVSAIISPENKRVGDYAAGTIVVRESRVAAPMSLRQTLAAAAPRSSAYLSDEERELISGYLARRDRMQSESRREFAAQLAQRVRARAPADLQRLNDEELLERV